MHKVFLVIGANIGNKKFNFQKVHVLIEDILGRIVNKSSIYETPPWGFNSEDNFWNQVLLIETGLLPEKLLHEIHYIEKEFNRKHIGGQYISREMDIDILYYDNISINTTELKIPHPLIQQRLFVLVPLNEIDPDSQHPSLRLTNRQLLADCKDRSIIKKYK